YSASSDATVKRRILSALRDQREKDRLLEIAKAEKNVELRMDAIRCLSDVSGSQAEIWQLYQTETSPEIKQQILQSLPQTGNQEKMLDLIRTEKENSLRKMAIQRLGEQRAST